MKHSNYNDILELWTYSIIKLCLNLKQHECWTCNNNTIRNARQQEHYARVFRITTRYNSTKVSYDEKSNIVHRDNFFNKITSNPLLRVSVATKYLQVYISTGLFTPSLYMIPTAFTINTFQKMLS